MGAAAEALYDVVVVGGGPAGLTAALYLARAKYRVVVVEKEKFGGQITITSEVVNYPGVGKISGTALTETMRRQAEGFGAEFMLTEVEKLELAGDIKKVHTGRGILSCFGVLLATGAHPRMVGFAGEEEFRGHGVAYCATCDGEFFTGKEVFVVGGGFAAAEEAVFLTKYATHVTILVRGKDFSCAAAAAEPAKNHEKISVLYNTEVVSVEGDAALRKLTYRNKLTGEVSVYEGDGFGVFVFAGYAPETDLVRGVAELNEQGYVLTDRQQKTSVDGLYAAGDVCIKSLRQVVTAVGDGALAATELEHYAARMQKKTHLKPAAAKKAAPNPVKEAQKPQAAAKKGLFSPEIQAQLAAVFGRMAAPLTLEVHMDARPVSKELVSYMEELAAQTEKLTVRMEEGGAEELPCVRVLKDGVFTGLAFHGVPGGHEFTSFVLGLYNAAGPGQPLDATLAAQIAAIDRPVRIEVMVSLSCTMCPDTVTAAQKIASLNPLVTAEIYDLNHFPARKDRYKVMSVPCMVIDGKAPAFGKKNVGQILGLIG